MSVCGLDFIRLEDSLVYGGCLFRVGCLFWVGRQEEELVYLEGTEVEGHDAVFAAWDFSYGSMHHVVSALHGRRNSNGRISKR